MEKAERSNTHQSNNVSNRIMLAIFVHRLKFGVSPTLRELASACHLKSPSSVARHLRRLEQRGLIHLEPARRRGIRLPSEEE